MNKFALCLICLMNICSIAVGQTIADCKDPSGFALYHSNNKGKKLDFEKDSITGGMLSIIKTKDEKYDLIVVDSRRKITSMTQDGGDFVLLRKGETDLTFLLYFPNSSIELYTLWLDSKGKAKLDMMQSRGGDTTSLNQHKSSLMTADCNYINFKVLSE
jgi:hypothetical protein